MSKLTPEQASNNNSQPTLLEVLAQAVPFNEHELSYYEQGRLTSSQRWGLASKIILGFVTCLFFGVLTSLYAYNYSQQYPALQYGWKTILLPGLAWLVPACLNLIFHWANFRDAMHGHVESVSGTGYKEVKKTSGYRNDYTFYVFKIEKQEFKLNSRVFFALKDGISYTVYFTPASKQLLAIVPTRKDLPANTYDSLTRRTSTSSPYTKNK